MSNWYFHKTVYSQFDRIEMQLRFQHLLLSAIFILMLNSCNDNSTDPEDLPCGWQTVNYLGKVYNTVEIGEQCWLKENLNAGTMVISDDSSSWQTDNGIIEKYCYNNDPANCETYGGLYNWYEAMNYDTSEGSQGICPEGWHIPTRADILVLQDYVNNQAAKLVAEGEPAKRYSPTDETGFSGLFSGFRLYNDGQFYKMGQYGYFWTSTEYLSNISWRMYLNRDRFNVLIYYAYKHRGLSVRCIKD